MLIDMRDKPFCIHIEAASNNGDQNLLAILTHKHIVATIEFFYSRVEFFSSSHIVYFVKSRIEHKNPTPLMLLITIILLSSGPLLNGLKRDFQSFTTQ